METQDVTITTLRIVQKTVVCLSTFGTTKIFSMVYSINMVLKLNSMARGLRKKFVWLHFK